MTSPSAFKRYFAAVNRRLAWERLERAYAAYRAAPAEPQTRFAAMRALVKICRLLDLSGKHAALIAELGRIDDEAPAHWQLVLQPRKPTRPHREKQREDKARHTRSMSQGRKWRRFMAVMDRIEAAETLPNACAAVAAAEGAVDAETVRQDYLAIAGQYRRAGYEVVEFGNDDALRRISLPRRGRPRKNS